MRGTKGLGKYAPRIEQKSSGGMTKPSGNDAFLVAPAEAGVHASKQDWIPATL